MAEIVFVLGAGASRHAGAPLMDDFWAQAERLSRDWESSSTQKKAFDAVRRVRGQLQAVHSKARLDLNNIESIFAAFEMGRQIGRLPQVEDDEELSQLIVSLKVVMFSTIEESIKYPVEDTVVRPTKEHDQLAHLVKSLIGHSGKHNCSIITFNYDITVDFALASLFGHVDYGLQGPTDYAPLLKLHGSLNWTTCSKCRTVFPLQLQEIWHGQPLRYRGHGPRTPVVVAGQLPALCADARFQHCKGESPDGTPFLVPPTWNKGAYQQTAGLVNVWRRAAAELREAESIFICGYSLAETDQFFRYLFALATEGPSPLKRVWVFDPEQDPGRRRMLDQRFRGLVGPGAESTFQLRDETFEDCLPIVKEALTSDGWKL